MAVRRNIRHALVTKNNYGKPIKYCNITAIRCYIISDIGLFFCGHVFHLTEERKYWTTKHNKLSIRCLILSSADTYRVEAGCLAGQLESDFCSEGFGPVKSDRK